MKKEMFIEIMDATIEEAIHVKLIYENDYSMLWAFFDDTFSSLKGRLSEPQRAIIIGKISRILGFFD
jgi:hypothetical protein